MCGSRHSVRGPLYALCGMPANLAPECKKAEQPSHGSRAALTPRVVNPRSLPHRPPSRVRQDYDITIAIRSFTIVGFFLGEAEPYRGLGGKRTRGCGHAPCQSEGD